MVAMYTIAGRQFGSHQLAMGVLGTFAGTVGYFATRGKTSKGQGPPINAQSPDEEKFIQDFLKNAEVDSGKKSNVPDMKKKDAGR